MSSAPKAGWDPTWEEIFRNQEWGKYPPEHVVRFVARNFYRVPDRKTVRLLDLGCGPGACIWYMAREGFSVAGIDGSETAIRQAAQRLKAEGLAADLQNGDYTDLPWPDGSFDGVIDNVTLYCNRFENCQRAVAEVKRVLKPRGVFLSCNFTDRTWGYGKGRKIEFDGFTDILEGPLHGKGFALFLSKQRVDELYQPFQEVKVERLSWTAEEMRHLIELWLVEARKVCKDQAGLTS
jgi:ubiquinone/menaquinone biosynthesis C-methylase UbiE